MKHQEKSLSFSVAGKINVILSNINNKKVQKFLCKIYKNFDNIVDSPEFTIDLLITDVQPKLTNKILLGHDASYDKNTLCLNSGHYFLKNSINSIVVGVPSKVKRGRVPFKRAVPGRHITDEIIEPLIQIALLKCNFSFLHASSLFENGKVDILMAWRGTGKTNAILEGIKLNKEIWSDDLTIIDSNGTAYPYLRPIRLYSYNIPLLSFSYIKKHKLRIKRYLTPPWQPVNYLELRKTTQKFAKINSIKYLNNLDKTHIASYADDVMCFEQIFFSDIRIMLKHSGIFYSDNTVERIVNDAISNLNF